MRAVRGLSFLLSLVLGHVLLAQSPDERAGQILDQGGVAGGLIVHVGCGDPDLLVSLHAGDAYLVHGLDTDAAMTANAREQIKSRGAYGKVSADTWDGKRLPYADNLVNLLVVNAGNRVPKAEVTRVLAPRGVALIHGTKGETPAAGWTKIGRPWPAEIDEWTHWLHGADGNAVADDTCVGPPRYLQWIEDPLWLKHHNTTISFSAMVSAKGRLFYIIDESSPGVFGLPQKWALLARDAFNGTLLWKRKIENWGWKAWVETGQGSNSRFDQPTDLQRRLIAVGDFVYLPLGAQAPLSQLHAATGEVVRTYPGTERVSEVLHHDAKLIVCVHGAAEGAKDGLLEKSVLVFDADSAELLWKKDGLKGVAGKTNALKKYTSLYLAAGGSQLFCVDAESVVGMDINAGEELWRVPRPPREATLSRYAQLYVPDLCSLVVCGDFLLLGQSEACDRIPWNEPVRTKLLALRTTTGEKAWEFDCGNWSYGSPVDLFVRDNLVWVHTFGEYALAGIDVSTGKVRQKFPTSQAMDGAHHHRCYRNKATAKYVLAARRGVEFIGLDDGENRLHHWVRGACRYGVLPCNGLLYSPPNPCMCYATAKVNGFLALAAKRKAYPLTPSAERLQRGPAFGKIDNVDTLECWATYRHDANRSGSTPTPVDSNLEQAWQAKIGGRLSSVTVADGKVFVASIDTHTVHALEAASGTELWQYTAGGPVDSPPTFHNGMVLFGSADGRVYCLNGSEGTLVWRFQAAPADMRISAFGHLESAWPVHGSVLVQDDVAYVAAGRSSFLDGGIHLYALDPATGELLQTRTLHAPDLATGKGDYDSSLRYDMPPDSSGTLSDILVSDGKFLHMRHTKIDPKDIRKDFERDMTERQRAAFYQQKQMGKVLDFGRQVASSAGLLDGSWFNQTFWSFENASHGRLLVYDEQATYGLKAYPGGASRHTRTKFTAGTSKYTLFADDRQSRKRRWSIAIPVRVRAMVAAGDRVFVAGMPDRVSTDDPWAAYEGRGGGLLRSVSKKDGKMLAKYPLEAPPVWEGMAAANARIYIATMAGQVECWK